MSGGYWNYENDVLAHEIFGYHFDFECGLEGSEHDFQYEEAVKKNPLKDRELSALAFDVFCLLHSFDWAESGDTDWDNYHSSVFSFKKRWFEEIRSEQIRRIIDISILDLKNDLYRTFIEESEKEN